MLRRMKRMVFLIVILSGCWGPSSLDNAEPFYTGEISRPPIEVAECVQARYLLAENRTLTIVRDGDTVILSHGLVTAWYNQLYWRAMITPGRIVIRSHEVGIRKVEMDWIRECSA
jgi:hypothetical protein